MKSLLLLPLAIGAATLSAAADSAPEVSDVTMEQSADRRPVTIRYTLENAPAIVTLDVQTNRTGAATDDAADWASVGGAALHATSGDVWRKVEPGQRKIVWRPDRSWRGLKSGAARAVVTAWRADNPPDYLVADLSDGAAPGGERYYPSAAFLPGGLLANRDYRTTRLVLRKVPAKGVTWTMGSATDEKDFGRDATKEKQHDVTMESSYYIGVFPVTQEQWWHVWQTTGSALASSNTYFCIDSAMRPAEWMTYNGIRNAASAKAKTVESIYDWPNDPNPKSFLGRLRTKTGLKFDLPSEAQWEFACRAGTGSGTWNDGSAIVGKESDANLDRLGRTKCNGGKVQSGSKWNDPSREVSTDQGTAIVGSYEPNAWGLYDMHGNVWEYCLDWFEKDISSLTDGRPNIDPSDSAKTRSGATGTTRVRRGGAWGNDAYTARSAYRLDRDPGNQTHYAGLRLALPLGE